MDTAFNPCPLHLQRLEMYRPSVIGFEQAEQQPGGTHDLYASVPVYIEAIAELNWKAFRGVAFHIKGFQSRHIVFHSAASSFETHEPCLWLFGIHLLNFGRNPPSRHLRSQLQWAEAFLKLKQPAVTGLTALGSAFEQALRTSSKDAWSESSLLKLQAPNALVPALPALIRRERHARRLWLRKRTTLRDRSERSIVSFIKTYLYRT